MMQKLPFQVRSAKPKIIQVNSNTVVPKGVREGRWGESAVTFKGKIYLFRNVPRYTLEHEKAHILIKKEDNPTLTGVTAELDDEVKADLYTYHKIGEPKNIVKHLHSRAGDSLMTHIVFDKKKRYNYYNQTKHMLYHIKKVYKKYWDYMPEQWKKDYNDFVASVHNALRKAELAGRDRNPPGDYKVNRLRSGAYDIKRIRVKAKCLSTRLVSVK